MVPAEAVAVVPQFLDAAPSSLERCLPCQVIIAEPFLKIMTYGERGIRVDNPAEIQIFLPGVKPLPELHRSIAGGGYGASTNAGVSSAAKTPQRDVKISRDLFEDPYVPGKRVKLIGLTSKKGLRLNGKFGVVAAEQDETDLERITVQVGSDSGKPDSLKVRPSNLEIVPDASLEDILRSKTEANEAFSKGDLERLGLLYVFVSPFFPAVRGVILTFFSLTLLLLASC